MDPEDHLGPLKRPEIKQRRPLIQKEINLKNARHSHRPLSPTHLNLSITYQNLNPRHRTRPST